MGETVSVIGYSTNPDSIRKKEWRQKNRERNRKNSKRYYYKNRDKILERHRKWGKNNREKLRNYERQTRLSVNGKRIRIKKREYPINQKCELCNRKKKRLGYHHWDNNQPELGMWICVRCHHVAEALEDLGKNLVKKYFKLKEEIKNGRNG